MPMHVYIEDIAKEIESVGGSIDSYGGNNSFGVNLELLSSDFSLGLDLLTDVLLNPIFPAPELERERQVQLAGIRAQKDQLLQSASRCMRRALFGEVAYGLDALGTESSVAHIQVADLKSFHAQHGVPTNCVLAIFGDVNTEQVRAAIEDSFGHWQSPKQRSAATSELKLKTLDSINRVTETRDKKQAVLLIGFRGTTLLDADRYPLELLQEACSDLGSRLFVRIRDELGLAYYVGAQNFLGLAPGYFAFYVGTMPEKADLVEKELLREAELLRLEGLTAQELKRAKAKNKTQTQATRHVHCVWG